MRAFTSISNFNAVTRCQMSQILHDYWKSWLNFDWMVKNSNSTPMAFDSDKTSWNKLSYGVLLIDSCFQVELHISQKVSYDHQSSRQNEQGQGTETAEQILFLVFDWLNRKTKRGERLKSSTESNTAVCTGPSGLPCHQADWAKWWGNHCMIEDWM